MSFIWRVLLSIATALGMVSKRQPASDGRDPSGDLAILFAMSGEVEACTIVGALQERGVYPEAISVVGFEKVTVRVKRNALEHGKKVLAQLQTEMPFIDWKKGTIAPEL